MDSPPPLVSVVMPCYNHGKFVAESMLSILGQTVPSLELIVIDDASKDDSVTVIRELAKSDSRVKLIASPQNRGASASRNAGLQAAQGDYVAFCDADDLWYPNKLKEQIELLGQNPDCDVTHCASELIDENGILTGELFTREFPVPMPPSGDLFEALSERNFINMQTVLVRRLAVRELLLFDKDIKWVEDWWLWIRLARHHRFVYEPSILAQYRVHSHSTARTQKFGIRRNRWKVFKRNLRTHRDAPLEFQSKLWYKMGQELSLIGKHGLARRFFYHATALAFKGKTSTKTRLVMIARSAVELGRSLRFGRSQEAR